MDVWPFAWIMFVPYMHAVPTETRRGCQITGTGVRDGSEPSCGHWESTLGSLEDSQSVSWLLSCVSSNPHPLHPALFFFETGFLYVTHDWPGTCYVNQAGMELTETACLCFPYARIKGMCMSHPTSLHSSQWAIPTWWRASHEFSSTFWTLWGLVFLWLDGRGELREEKCVRESWSVLSICPLEKRGKARLETVC